MSSLIKQFEISTEIRAVISIPVPVFCNNRKKKLGLICISCLAVIVIIVSGVRVKATSTATGDLDIVMKLGAQRWAKRWIARKMITRRDNDQSDCLNGARTSPKFFFFFISDLQNFEPIESYDCGSNSCTSSQLQRACFIHRRIFSSFLLAILLSPASPLLLHCRPRGCTSTGIIRGRMRIEKGARNYVSWESVVRPTGDGGVW